MALLPPDPLYRFKGEMKHLNSLCFPTNSLLMAASSSGDVHLWNLETSKQSSKLHIGDSVQSVHLASPDVMITREKNGLISLRPLKADANPAANPATDSTATAASNLSNPVENPTLSQSSNVSKSGLSPSSDLIDPVPNLTSRLAAELSTSLAINPASNAPSDISDPALDAASRTLKNPGSNSAPEPGLNISKPASNLPTHASEPGFCRLALCGRVLATPQAPSGLSLLDPLTLAPQATLALPHPSPPLGATLCLAAFPAQRLFFAGYESGHVVCWSPAPRLVPLPHPVTCLAFDPIKRRLVCGTASDLIHVLALQSDGELKPKCELKAQGGGASVVRLRPDSKILVVGCLDGAIVMYSWKSLRRLVVLKEHKGAVNDVAFSPGRVEGWNCSVMAAAGADGMITLWNLYN